MHVIKARNAHDMLPAGLKYIHEHGKGNGSRNGTVLRLHGPTTLVYERPDERVLFHPERNANPFFHVYESCWMMAGRNDVAAVAHFVPRMGSFSDDGVTFNGAYGYRWRVHFNGDQLFTIADALRKNPDCRRQVLGIWDATHDLGLESKDIPCNLLATFQIADGKLDMMVANRSNDMVWGAIGANVVHFSFLQECMAHFIGVPVGSYWQVSANMHLYTDKHAKLMERFATQPEPEVNPYDAPEQRMLPTVSVEPERWFSELAMVLETNGDVMGIKDAFLKGVLIPVIQSWDSYKDRDWIAARSRAKDIKDTYWQRACVEWLIRRQKAEARMAYAQDDGVIYE